MREPCESVQNTSVCTELCQGNKYLRSGVCICIFVLNCCFSLSVQRMCQTFVCIADVCYKANLIKSPLSLIFTEEIVFHLHSHIIYGLVEPKERQVKGYTIF